MATTAYHRIVANHERMHDVQKEAIENWCFVWSDGVRSTVISRNRPSKRFHKVNAGYQFPTDNEVA